MQGVFYFKSCLHLVPLAFISFLFFNINLLNQLHLHLFSHHSATPSFLFIFSSTIFKFPASLPQVSSLLQKGGGGGKKTDSCQWAPSSLKGKSKCFYKRSQEARNDKYEGKKTASVRFLSTNNYIIQCFSTECNQPL